MWKLALLPLVLVAFPVAGCGPAGPMDVTAGNTTVHARGDGSFDLTVGGRALLGFGAQYQTIDHRAEAFPLWVSEQGIGRAPAHPSPFGGNPWTTYFPAPFFLDPRGYGLAVDPSARVDVDLCKSDPSAYTITI